MSNIIDLQDHRDSLKYLDELAGLFALDYEAIYHEPPEDIDPEIEPNHEPAKPILRLVK